MCAEYIIIELCTHWLWAIMRFILLQTVYPSRKPLCLYFIVHPSKSNVLIEMRNTHVQRTRQHHSLAAAKKKKKTVQRNSFMNEGISVVSVLCSYSCGLYVVRAAGSANRQSQIANRMSGATTIHTHKSGYETIDTHTHIDKKVSVYTIIEFINWIFHVNTELRRSSPVPIQRL